jgi:Trypsin-co-occurring domain 1
MDDFSDAEAPPRTRVVPVEIEGRTILMEATDLGGEEEVAGGLMSFEGVSQAIEVLSTKLGEAASKARPDRVTLEFGCEVATESGVLTAVFVKGAGKANVRVVLEWERSRPRPGVQ